MKFKEYLIETIMDNQMELLIPSKEYTEEEVVYMRGYQQALQDMLDDFTEELDTITHEKYTFSLN
jgi:DNA-binding transcriptional MocR family regulator